MSQTVYENLVTVYEKLKLAKSNIAASKQALYEALAYNGITNVTASETFERYASLIRKLKSANSMVLEFTIPATAATDYKRTIVLPLYFGSTSSGYAGGSLDAIAQEIIAADGGVYSSPSPLAAGAVLGAPGDDGIITDFYGNECTDGNYTIEAGDIAEYLDGEQQEELLSEILAGAGGYVLSPAGERAGMVLGADDDATDAVYAYTVDWGDGSGECQYAEYGSYDANKAAIWHTYAGAGTYDVTITGNFRRMRASTYVGNTRTSLTAGGDYVYDTDGEVVYSNENYAMRNHLVEVIAWGNTLLTDMSYAFCQCRALATIPMYDTTNSFADVTAFSYMFNYCTSLTSLPFNASTDKGLFSGCSKATTFASAFYYCTGLTGSIPDRLIDGCPGVTSVQGMFQGAKLTGDIPSGLLSGMTALTSASQMFSGCSLSGALPDDLFADCPNVTTIAYLFRGCSGVTGRVRRDLIGGLSKLTDMRQAFYGCSGIEGIDNDAFYNLVADNINCREAFKGCAGITEIPEGLLESLTGAGLMLERMFDGCTGVASLAATSLQGLKAANARGMFGGCSALASACPDANPDWESYDTMKKWYGAFAGTALPDIADVCVELGGDGERRFPQGSVGKIVLRDNTLVEAADYAYDSSNTPIGVVYADVYLDEGKSVATLANGGGNVVGDGTEGSRHVLLAMALTDTSKMWSTQLASENVTTITNTTNYNVGYNLFTYTASTDDGGNVTYSQSRAATRYCGEAYSRALSRFIFEGGYATNVVTGSYTSYSVVGSLPTSASEMVATNIYYVADAADDSHYLAYVVNVSSLVANADLDVYLGEVESDRYPAITYCDTYSVNGVTAGTCFMPDGADLWDMYTQRRLINKATAAIIAGGNGFTSSNCYPLRENAAYWSSAGYSSSSAWGCNTYNAYLGAYYKWNSYYVRPALAIEA